MPNSKPADKIFTQHARSIAEEAIMIGLILLSLIGIGVMRFSPSDGYIYWISMIFVFGMAAMAISYLQAKQGVHIIRNIWVEQSLHWFGAILATGGTLVLAHLTVLDDDSTGLVLLLILSLATYTDGLRIGWRFGLVGNFLGLTAIAIPFSEYFMWLLFVIAALTIGLTIYLEKRPATTR